MTPIVVESSPSAGVVYEGFVLDGLNLNDGGTFKLTALSMPPPKKRPEWAEHTDGDGALLIRDPLFENRTIEATVEVWAATRDAGHVAVGQIVDKLEEAERHLLGIPLVWTPADSTKSLTFYLLTGEVTEYPIEVESGYFANPPVLRVVLSLTCRPFGYGAEVTVAASSSTAGPLVIYSIADVAGDVPAEARLIVTDTQGQSRDYVCWGLEWRYQNGEDLVFTTPDLTVTGFAGTSTTRSGSVSTNIFRGTLTTTPVAVCGTGNKPHIGSFHVFARYWATGTGVRLRLTYRDGDGPLTSLLYATPPAEDAWCETDLGIVTIPPKLLGTQRWQAQVEAYTDTPGDTIDIDGLWLVPAGEGFGKARRPVVFETPTAFTARDEFDQAAGVLVGKTAPSGGTWSGTGGGGTDFQVEETGHTAERTAVSDAAARYNRLGTGTATAIGVQVDTKTNGTGPIMGPFARYTNTSNLIEVRGTLDSLSVVKVEAGVAWFLGQVVMAASAGGPLLANQWYTHRLVVLTSGRWFYWAFPRGSLPGSPLLSGTDSALATGGALASGGYGIMDYWPSGSAKTRNFDNFLDFVPTTDAAIHASQSIEFRHDETLREDSTGIYWGPPLEPRGAPFFIPPAGDEDRTSRVAVLARRNDIETMAEANPTDTQTVQVLYTPRYMSPPR